MRRTLTSTALTVVLVASVVGCSSDQPSISPPDGAPTGSLLVLETRPCNFLRPPDPNQCVDAGLVRIGLDGDVLDELTPAQPMPLRSFALSPAHDAIAWTWNWELWTAPLSGGATRLVSRRPVPESGERVRDPAWSPDGSELLYRWEGPNEEVTWYRVRLDTGAMVEVRMPVDCRAMAWSPDGTTVACEVERAGSSADRSELSDIYLVDLATLRAAPLTNPDDRIGEYRPDWSPDGRWLAFARWTDEAEMADEFGGIWVVEVESGEGRRVAAGLLSVPAWSPDGGHLVAFDDELLQVVVVGRDGSGLTVVEHEPHWFVAPRWLPDA